MLKKLIKKVLKALKIDINKVNENTIKWSIRNAISHSNLKDLPGRLRKIEPDISAQYSIGQEKFNDLWELKMRGLHAFQCSLMLKALEFMPSKKHITVVDIGDSAGTHMSYLKNLTKDRLSIEPLSVNLDKRAIDKIKGKGLEAILCRAEDLDLGDREVDLFVSFEMVEHLHNPAIFFHRLAEKSKCNKILVSVPYLKKSRIGLHNVRNKNNKKIYAEDEHIFELCPEDWSLLLSHSGWKVLYQDIYYQYPNKFPIVSALLAKFWRKIDFEGFWGVILEKDDTYSKLYQDWED